MLRTVWGTRGCMGCSWIRGVLLATMGAPDHNGCSWPRWVLLTPAAPCGEQQARRRELLTAASCSLRLSTSRCAASARCKRAESTSGGVPHASSLLWGRMESQHPRPHIPSPGWVLNHSSTPPRMGQRVQPALGEPLCRGKQSPSLQGPPSFGEPSWSLATVVPFSGTSIKVTGIFGVHRWVKQEGNGVFALHSLEIHSQLTWLAFSRFVMIMATSSALQGEARGISWHVDAGPEVKDIKSVASQSPCTLQARTRVGLRE